MSKPHPKTKPQSLSRVIKSDSTMKVKPLGGPRWHAPDVYHQLLRTTWTRLTLVFLAAFFLFNLIFAFLFSLDPEGLVWHDRTQAGGPFWQLFFFSVETVATVGYGNIVPASLYTNIVASIEISFGILFFALVTGIMFARFSRPTARILFSKVAVISAVDGVPTLMLRAANQRHNLIFEASATVSLLGDEVVEGSRMRRFRDLVLTRSANPIFTLTWTIMHPIDEASPLHPWLAGKCAPDTVELIVVLSGVDERSGQVIHGRWGYTPKDLRWDARFVDILGQAEDGTRTIDYGRFDEVAAPASPECRASAST